MKKIVFTIFAILNFIQISLAQPWSAGTGSTIYYSGGSVGVGTTTPASPLLLSINGVFQSTNLLFSSAGGDTFAGIFSPSFTNNGGANTIFGYSSLVNSSSTNTILGALVASNLTTAYKNVLIGAPYGGSATAQSLTTGNNLVFIGNGSGSAISTATGSIGIGATSLRNASGSGNIAIGSGANAATGAGTYNLSLGALSGAQTTSGSNNVNFGYEAGGIITTGYDLTFLGSNAGYTGSSNSINNSAAIGYNAQVTSSNSIVLGNGANVGIGTTSPTQLLQISFGAGPATSQFDITSNGTGAISATDLGMDNSTVSFDSDYSGSAWIARDTSAAWLWKNGGQLKIMGSAGNTIGATAAQNQLFTIDLATGNISVGTTSSSGYQFAVNGTAIAAGLTVKNVTDWPDNVFDKEYKLLSLQDMDNYLRKNHHLPGFPTAAQIDNKGLDMGKMSAMVMKKVEELTLYLIADEKTLNDDDSKIAKLEAIVDHLVNKQN